MATSAAMNPFHNVRHWRTPERFSHASRQRQHCRFPTDRVKISVFNDVLGADLTGPQSSAADPPANRLRVAPGSASGFWDGKHVVRCYNIPPLHPSASPLGLGGLSRELPTQERNVERWLGDRDRR